MEMDGLGLNGKSKLLMQEEKKLSLLHLHRLLLFLPKMWLKYIQFAWKHVVVIGQLREEGVMMMRYLGYLDYLLKDERLVLISVLIVILLVGQDYNPIKPMMVVILAKEGHLAKMETNVNYVNLIPSLQV